MKNLLLALLLTSCGACIDTQSPNVQIVGNGDHEALVDGANSWLSLGYRATLEPIGLPECADVREALAGEACQITIAVRWQLGLIETRGVNAMADRRGREVVIDMRYQSYYQVLPLAAHELGHVLLDSGHLPEGVRGIMGVSAGLWSPTDADYALACESLGVCNIQE